MDKELQKTTLRVAIVSDDFEKTEYCYRTFLEENQENVLIPGKDKAVLKDGTIVEKMCVYELLDHGLDQIVLCINDDISDGCIKNLIDCLNDSQVPKNYWFLWYADTSNDYTIIFEEKENK